MTPALQSRAASGPRGLLKKDPAQGVGPHQGWGSHSDEATGGWGPLPGEGPGLLSGTLPEVCPRPNHPAPENPQATVGEPQPLRALGLKASPRSPWVGTPYPCADLTSGTTGFSSLSILLPLPTPTPPTWGCGQPRARPLGCQGASGRTLPIWGAGGHAFGRHPPVQMSHWGREKEAPSWAASSRPAGAPRLLFADPKDGTPAPKQTPCPHC